MTAEPLTVTSSVELEDWQPPCNAADGFAANSAATFRWPCPHQTVFIVCQSHADRYRTPLPQGEFWICHVCGQRGVVVSVVKL